MNINYKLCVHVVLEPSMYLTFFIDCKLHEDKGFCLCCSQLYSQSLKQCLKYRRCSINTY